MGKEAAYIAHTINSLLKGGKIYKDGIYRDVTYSDMTLLAARRTDNVKSVIGHLRALGIPVSGGGLIKGEGNVYIDRLLDYMRVIDNFRQDIPLAGALMYFGGFTCNDCAVIREGGKEYLWQSVLDYAAKEGALAERVADFIAKIRRYRFMSGFTDVAELAAAIVSDFDYAERIASRPDGEKQVSELRSFIQGLKSKSYGNSLSAFLDAVKEGYEGEEAQSVGAGGCVSAMTVHASKGLEFPIVFLIDCGARFSNGESKDKLILDKDMGLALDAAESGRRLIMPTVAKAYAKDVIDTKYITDRMRLFYVGLTRARNYLYVTGTLYGSADDFGSKYKDNIGSMADWINNVCCLDKNFAAKYVVTDGDFEVEQDKIVCDCRPDIDSDCDFSYLIEYADKKYAYEECTHTGIKYSVSAINNENYNSGYGYGGGSYLFGEESNTVGSAYHKVLSLIDFDVKDVSGVRSAIDDMVSSKELSAQAAELVDCNIVAECLNSPLMTRARGARHMRERKFTLSLPACEVLKDCNIKDKILVQGAVDLMILGGERGGENVLVDFKYTTRPVQEVKKAYAAQLRLYALAMEKCAGIKPDRVVLYLLGSNTEVEM
ncbi:MAG: PD-(D/E)XK nuclease family protein [Clostridia bacterium]|nr:PD-(D/E)XK nuclease family protein [Clostridia bacterium]